MNVPQEGGRGFTLAKWALWVGAGTILGGFIMLVLGKLPPESFDTVLLYGAALSGVGPAGHQVSNAVERIGINKNNSSGS